MNELLTVIGLDIITANGCREPSCKDPLCGKLVLAPNCHRKGVAVAYKNGSGIIVVSCFKCEKFVCSIKVAES